VEVLLEVVAEREVEERPAVGGQFHRRRQAALHDREIARGEVAVQLVDVGAHLEAVVLRQALGIDARPGDDDHAELGHPLLRLRERGDHAPQQVPADPRAPDGHDADLLVVAVPECLAVAERCRVEPRHVAGEVVVLLGPFADQRQVGPERVRHDVVRIADEHGPVADAREARDVLDHLGVVVGGQERLVVAAVGHRQPPDEVGEPAVGRPLLLGVLVQVVVELPGLVPDPEVVVLVADDVVEEHEVRKQDLVHPANRLEAMQVVLRRLALDVPRLVRQQLARWVEPLAARLEHGGDGMLREPVDLEVRTELAQLVRDRDVALRMPEPDRRRDVERTLAPRLAADPAPGRPRRLDEVAQ
jgi:hypothetical protein